jgi:hypothetical protein
MNHRQLKLTPVPDGKSWGYWKWMSRLDAIRTSESYKEPNALWILVDVHIVQTDASSRNSRLSYSDSQLSYSDSDSLSDWSPTQPFGQCSDDFRDDFRDLGLGDIPDQQPPPFTATDALEPPFVSEPFRGVPPPRDPYAKGSDGRGASVSGQNPSDVRVGEARDEKGGLTRRSVATDSAPKANRYQSIVFVCVVLVCARNSRVCLC